MSDNIYTVELDGKVYTVQSDHPPTEDDILGSIAHDARQQSEDAPGQYLGQMVGNVPRDLVAQGKGAVDLVRTLAGAAGEAGNAIGSQINEAVFGPNARYQRQGPLQSGSQTSAADRQRELGKPDQPTPNMDALSGVVPGVVQHYKDYLDADKRAQMVRDHPVGLFLDLAGGVEGIRGGVRAAPGVIAKVPKATGAVARAIPPELVTPVAAAYGAYTRGSQGFIEGLAGGSVLDRMLERARGIGVTKRAAGPLSFEERFPGSPPLEPSEGLAAALEKEQAAALAKAQADALAAQPVPRPPPEGRLTGNYRTQPPARLNTILQKGMQPQSVELIPPESRGYTIPHGNAPWHMSGVQTPSTDQVLLDSLQSTGAAAPRLPPPDQPTGAGALRRELLVRGGPATERRAAYEASRAAEDTADIAAENTATPAAGPAAGPATSAATQADLMNEMAARRSAAAQKGWATRKAAAAAAQTPAPAPPPMQPVPSHVPTTPAAAIRPDYLGTDVTSPTAIIHDITQGNGGSIYEAGESYIELGKRMDQLLKNPTPADIEEAIKLARMRRQRVRITEERDAAAAKAAQKK